MADTESLAQGAVERLVENEALRGDLTDDGFGPIVEWASNALIGAAQGVSDESEAVAQARMDEAETATKRIVGEVVEAAQRHTRAERPAANRAMKALAVEDQPGPDLARSRSFDPEYRHQGTGFTGFERSRNVGPDLHADIAFTAFMIASGVAGASSGGMRPGFSDAIASVIAEKTESASISGGSPTALER